MGLEVATDGDDGEKEKPKPGRPSRAVAAAREDDIQDVLAWMAAQGSEASFRLTITRKWPLVGPGGENISGVLDTIEDRPENLNDYISQRWGGGTFDLKVEIPSAKRPGGWDYARRSRLQIAGDPKLDPKHHPSARGAVVEAAPMRDTLAERAFESAQRQAESDRRRADDLARELRDRPTGADPALIASLMARIDAMNQRMLEMATKEPPKDSFRDRILEQAVGGESQRVQDLQRQYEGRIDKMRDDHAAELRLISTNHADALKRAEDRHDKAMEATTRTHERTVAALEKAKDEAVRDLRDAHQREMKQADKNQDFGQKTLEAAHQARLDGLQAENKRLTSEMVDLKSQIGTLRSIKEKSPNEQIKELAAMKEGWDAITGGGGGGDDTWYAKLAGALANSEGVLALVDKIGGGDKDAGDDEPEQPAQPAAQPQQVQVQLPPPGGFFRHPQDGQIYRHIGNGQIQGPVDPQKVKRVALAGRNDRKQRALQARAAAAAAQTQAPPAATEDDALDAALAEDQPLDNGVGAIDNGLPRAQPNPAPRAAPVTPARAAPAKAPTADQIKQAVETLEASFRAKMDPAVVARTAKQHLDAGTLAHIQSVGVDAFLAAVGQSRPASPLVTQHGRTFVRAVGQALFGPAT